MHPAGSTAQFFDLERPIDRAKLESPELALGGLKGLVILDEIQRLPELFEVLRVLADRPERQARFLVLGSASPQLVQGSSESLAGRVSFVDLGGFTLGEVGAAELERLWVRGGFPRSFLAESEVASQKWRQDFARTFLERDLPQLGINVPSETMRRYWTMLAHYHAQIWNGAEFARSLGASESTARRYLDLLAGAYMLRVLPPWHANLRKRQVKSPKVYLRDSGLLHSLLQIQDLNALRGHPKLGASWEGFALEEALSILQTRDAYFWATHGGAELDLFVLHEGRRLGFEFKYHEAPRRSRSMTIAMEDLSLDALTVVHPGPDAYPIGERMHAVPLRELREFLANAKP
jgi:predicted AAA+ superfamily ATPase